MEKEGELGEKGREGGQAVIGVTLLGPCVIL